MSYRSAGHDNWRETAGVTRARYRLLGANTPWKRVRFTRGFGARAARRAMKSSGFGYLSPSECQQASQA